MGAFFSLTNVMWLIVGFSIVGMIIRPFKCPVYVCPMIGAIVLIVLGWMSPTEAFYAILSGKNVYCFIFGMILLSEVGLLSGLFDWLSSALVAKAKGSGRRLFVYLFLLAIVVTAFLSNDATAVVLTPAVAMAVKKAKVQNPLSYLFICAFVANAASFIFPISNAANLIFFGDHMPNLWQWQNYFLLPSTCVVAVTFVILYFSQRKYLAEEITKFSKTEALSISGKVAAVMIILIAITLLFVSYNGISLGEPTLMAGVISFIVFTTWSKKNPIRIVRSMSLGIFPLVACLFILVAAVDKSQVLVVLSEIVKEGMKDSSNSMIWKTGLVTAYGANVINNLPMGLFIEKMFSDPSLMPLALKKVMLIGVDLGPNLSVLGSLSTLLWMSALERNGISIRPLRFLKLGFWMMTVALLLAISCVVWF